jgi:ribosomal protein S12 methylthiotransferase
MSEKSTEGRRTPQLPKQAAVRKLCAPVTVSKSHSSSKRPVRVGLISLGCAKNLVDAEIMLGSLLKSGIEIVNDATTADAVIVNTCSFIDAAQEESVDAILESSEIREKTRPHQGIIVSGCLPQRFREELPKLLPEVDAFMGIDQVEQVGQIVQEAMDRRARKMTGDAPTSKTAAGKKQKIVGRIGQLERGRTTSAHEDEEKIRGTEKFGNTKVTLAAPQSPLVEVAVRPNYIPDYATPRFRLTPRHFAYVKIAEGCNHPCSFCIIPRMRGSHRSRTQKDIVAEARQLITEGVKELNLISQDSTYYGLDLRANHTRAISSPEKFAAAAKSLPSDATTLCSLLRELNALEGDFWIRLLYTHPAHWTDELIATIAACPKVARYIDIPLQHIHEEMLVRMRRETSQQHIVDLLAKIRAGIPGIAIRTTFIVGFPGETDAHFKTLLEFIRDTEFERLGVFTYSQQDGTVAGKMENQVPEKIRKQRQKRAMAEQLKVARKIAGAFVGKEINVLVEKEADAHALSRVEGANVSSWEHGLIRSAQSGGATLNAKKFLVARGESYAPSKNAL